MRLAVLRRRPVAIPGDRPAGRRARRCREPGRPGAVRLIGGGQHELARFPRAFARDRGKLLAHRLTADGACLTSTNDIRGVSHSRPGPRPWRPRRGRRAAQGRPAIRRSATRCAANRRLNGLASPNAKDKVRAEARAAAFVSTFSEGGICTA